MADNLGVSTGSNATVRTKDNAGVHLNVSAIVDETGATFASVTAAGLKVDLAKASIGTPSNVPQSATNVTILASNANRLGASIYNDADADLLIKYAATASSSSFTDRIDPKGRHTVFGNYTGVIDGIWLSAGAGAARVTELTA